MRALSHWFLFATLLGCTGNGKGGDLSDVDTGSNQGTETGDETVQATLLVLNPLDDSEFEGVEVESPAGLTDNTDSEGTVSFPLEASGTFQFSLQKDGAIDHLIFGPTGSEDFTYLAFLATDDLLAMVNGALGTSQEDGTGSVVVIIDYDNLEAVVGARASIGSDHSESWIMTDTGPTFGDTIPEDGNGVIVFPNIFPGETSVAVDPPDGVACSAFPGGGQMPNPPVFMNHVTVVTFHCRA